MKKAVVERCRFTTAHFWRQIPRAFLKVCLFTAIGSSSVQSQEAQLAPGKTEAPLSPELKAMRRLVTLGRHDELIEKTTLALSRTQTPDPRILYLRGYAERRVGWLDAAQHDLKPLGDFAPWSVYEPASKLVDEIEALLELRPPLEEVIRVGGDVAFRVYYSRNDDFTRNVIAALPRGYHATSTFLETQLHEISVFVFNDSEYERFFKFYSLLGRTPHVWWRFLSTSGTITISQRDGNGSVISPDITTFPQGIAHELTHVFMTRRLGKIKDFPNWFNEGSANLVSASLDPEALRRNDQKIQRLVRNRAILPLEQLTSHSSFHEAVDQFKEGNQKGDPYAQGLSMTRYLGMALKGMKLADFWVIMERKQSFAEAVKEGTGMTVPQFYDSWLQVIQN